MNKELLQLLKEKYDIIFTDESILLEAFTHSSYSNEHRKTNPNNNERLEFLGDAVLELLVSNYIFRNYSEMPEGMMTKFRSTIVREDSLSYFARECGFNKYVLLGRGEERSDARTRASLLCDLFEAFIGAVYIDQGLAKVQNFLEMVIFPKVEQGFFDIALDNKTKLQELLQRTGKVEIKYELTHEEGPAHNRVFYVEVYADGEKIGAGQGKNKKQAEQEAAKVALQKIKI